MRTGSWLLLPTMILAFSACGPARPPATGPATNSTAGENPLTAPADYLGAAAKAKQAATRTVDLASVTRAIQMFQASEGRNPRELQELVAQGYLPALPALPSGQRYQYDPATGQLRVVNQ